MTDKKYTYHKVSVYCTKDEMEQWNKLARRNGQTLSDWIRSSIQEREVFINTFNKNDTKDVIIESPEVSELIAENKSLKEEIVQLKSKVTEQEIEEDIDTKVLDVLNTEDWKSALQIAKDIGLYKQSLEIIASKSDDPAKRMSAGDTIWKARTDVELTLHDLAEKDVVESKKTKEVVLWRLK